MLETCYDKKSNEASAFLYSYMSRISSNDPVKGDLSERNCLHFAKQTANLF